MTNPIDNAAAGERLATRRLRSTDWDAPPVLTLRAASRVALLNPLVVKNGRRHHFLTDWTGSEYPSSVLLPSMEFLWTHAVLERAGIEVANVDASARGWRPGVAVDRVVASGADLVVISATDNSMDEVLRLASAIRAKRPAARVAVFGPPVTIRPERALVAEAVDYVIMGEPEKPTLDLALGHIAENLAVRENGTIRRLPQRLLDPLDWLPLPARHVLNRDDYVAPYSLEWPFTVVNTSRGCAYWRCSFCTQHVWTGDRLRRHSLDYVEADLDDAVRRYGFREIFFRDEVFTADRRRTLELCARILRTGLRFGWRATTRVDTVDGPLLAEMRKAGCYQISYGFESSSQEVLDRNEKMIELRQSVEAAAMTRAAGIEVVGNFVIGLQGDTRDNLRDIADYAVRLGCHFAQFTPAQVWHDYVSAETSGAMTARELRALSTRAYRRFFVRPAFVRTMLRRLRNPRLWGAIARSAFRLATQPQMY